MKGYKGFSKGLVCRGKQYAENTVFEEDTAEICKSGMHFCENPFDVLDYYGFVDNNGELNEYAEVEALDDAQTDDQKKFCTKKLKVGAKLGISGLVNAFVDFTLGKTKRDSAAMNSGDCSAATNTDDFSAAMNSGDCSVAMNTGIKSVAMNTGIKSVAMNSGDCSAATNTGTKSVAMNSGSHSTATNTGKNGFAISTGIEGKAKGALGCYIAVAEWTYDESANEYKLVGFKAHKVDGKTIKPDTFYSLKNGKFIAVK